MKIKTCKKCGFVGDESFFTKGQNVCKKCHNKYKNEWKKIKKIKEKDRVKDRIKTCSKCGFVGIEALFVDGENICKTCKKIYSKEYFEEIKKEKYKEIKTCIKCCIIDNEILFVVNGNICKKCQENYKKIINNESCNICIKCATVDKSQFFIGNICKKCKELYKNEWAKNNPEKVKKSKTKWRKNNPEKIKENNKNKSEQIREARRIYYINNCDRIKKNSSKNKEKRKKIDFGFKLIENFRARIGKMIKSQGFSKNGKSCKNYLPFNGYSLLLSVENKFEPWMNWCNYGVYKIKTWVDNDISTHLWNLDHWIPVCMFTYSSMEDINFKIVWSLHNLRPISAKQNILENHRKTIDKIYTDQEYKDLCILIELLKEIIYDPTTKPKLIVFYESMIKAKEDYEKENDINQIKGQYE